MHRAGNHLAPTDYHRSMDILVAPHAKRILLIGPSTRAMAYSARRAGLVPLCIDLFADTDLQAIAPVEVLPLGDYPSGLVDRLKQFPPDMPVLYTGGLENHPDVYLALQHQRPVWGYVHPDPQRGNSVRNPEFLDDLARTKAIFRPLHQRLCRDAYRWLVKPRAGAGGRGINFWNGEPVLSTHFLEQYLEGTSLAAAFLHDGTATRCLGVTEQLVGCDFAHASSPFTYVGSISCHLPILAELERIASVLTQADPYLRGLFGADLIHKDGQLYLLEVNPRYTASIELLELTLGISCLAQHARAFGCELPIPFLPPSELHMGKAIFFAPHALEFPATGPWTPSLPVDFWERPDFVDIPSSHARIEQGAPGLTLFATGTRTEYVRHQLQKRAVELDCLFRK